MYGLIPPHILYFLKSKNIDFYDFKSTRKDFPNHYNQFKVNFPISIKSIIFVITFNNFHNRASAPDITIIDNKLSVNYSNIIFNLWDFERSSSLYDILSEIKSQVSQNNIENVLKFKTKNSYFMNTINSLLSFIATRQSSYSFINPYFDLIVNFNQDNIDEIVISYPLDYKYEVSENISHYTLINIVANQDQSIIMHISFPNDFLTKCVDSFIPLNTTFSNVEEEITKLERKVYNVLMLYKSRENIINCIISMNIGYITELNKNNYLKATFYVSLKKESKTIAYFLSLNFKSDSTQSVEISLIDCLKLQLIKKKPISCSNESDFKINVLEFLSKIKE